MQSAEGLPGSTVQLSVLHDGAFTVTLDALKPFQGALRPSQDALSPCHCALSGSYRAHADRDFPTS